MLRKYIKNGFALMRGFLTSCVCDASNNKFVDKKIRIFLSAMIEFEKGATITIKKGTKIMERTRIVARKGAKLVFGENVSIGMDCKIICHERIEIGENTLISPNVLIFDHDHVFDFENGIHRKEFKSAPISIGRNCWIGSNTVILRGSEVGDNCVIGAGAVIKGIIPSNSKVVSKRELEIRGGT